MGDETEVVGATGVRPGDDGESSEGRPRRIGPYVIERVLGEGGMGVVYLAEQVSPVRRRVALKVVRLGGGASTEVIARFELERRVLALMQHPGIAQLYDAGVTPGGEPYFAMEYVEGLPLTLYCDRHRLPLRARLRLFQRVCAAVQHAHQKGVIHRDLKPSNLLVIERDGKPAPKVIDFGIAKAVGEMAGLDPMLTRLHSPIGTLAYMSPEQLDPEQLASEHGGAVAPLDTRSDVYALGVILYDLLSGAQTFEERSPAKLIDSILHQEPTPMSRRLRAVGETGTEIALRRRTDAASLAKALDGDLEWIARKALEKNPADRYPSVSELAADIERHLTDRPVLAGPAGLGYRLRKFVRRNRLAVAAGGLIALAFVAAFTSTAVALLRSQRAEARASREAEKARAANRLLEEMLRSASPDVIGREVKVADVLDRAAEELGTTLAAEPEVEATLRATLAGTYESLGLFEAAEREVSRALALRRQLSREPDEETIRLSVRRGSILESLGRLEDSETELKRAVELGTSVLGDDHAATLTARAALAGTYSSLSRLDEAERILRDAWQRCLRTRGPEDAQTIDIAAGLALVLSDLDRGEEAETMHRDLLQKARAVFGATHPVTLTVTNNLANNLADLGKYAESEALLRELIAEQLRVRGPEHAETLTSQHNLAIALIRQERHAEAETLERQVLATRGRVLGENHPHTLISLRTLGVILTRQGRFAEAEPVVLDAFRRTRDSLGPEHTSTERAITNVRRLYETWHRPIPAPLEAELAARE